jgi:conjugal transfer/type IV secretion protein DotA/TraY
MISLDPASNDISVQFLTKILGAGWQSWATGTSAAGAGGVLATMFEAVNSALLMLGAGILVYTHAVGAADMARTGQSKAGTWTFLRQALSMFMLAPVPWASGLNILQVIVMLVTSWGIGLADTVWSSGVGYVAGNGGSIQAPSGVFPISRDALAGMLKSGVIAQGLANEGYTVTSYSVPTYALQGTNPNAPGSGQSTQGPQNGIVVGYQAMGAGGSITPAAIGTVTVGCKPALCAGVLQGLKAVSTDLQPAITAAMSWVNSGQNGAPIPTGLFDKAAGDYAAAVQTAVNANAKAQNGGLSSQMSAFQSGATSTGWASAGVYFYQISRFNEDASGQSISLSYGAPNMTALSGVISDGTNSALSAITQYVSQEDANTFGGSAMVTGAGAGAMSGGTCPKFSDGVWPALACLISTPLLQANGAAIHAMTSGDPIINIQSASMTGIDVIGGLVGTWAGANAAAAATSEGAKEAAAEGRSVPIIGALTGAPGAIAATIAYGAKAGIASVAPFFWSTTFTSLALLSIGAYYLPMLPAILFSIGVIGWVVLVLEMLVAAPLWAFSHVLPEGDGLMGSSARAGYFHALDIFARPVLMIFGLFLAILVVNAAAWFLGTGLQIAFASSMQGSVVGPWSAMMELTIIMVAVYLMANKSVHLISVVPGKVMRWIGQSMGVGDEVQDESRVNAMVGARLQGAATGLTKNKDSEEQEGTGGPVPSSTIAKSIASAESNQLTRD